MLDRFIDKRTFEDVQAPARSLRPEHLEAYNRDGFVVLRSVISKSTVNTLRQSAERLFASTEHEWISGPQSLDGDLHAHAHGELVRGIVQDLNHGPSEILLGFLYRKRSSSPKPKLWHQDGVYWDTSDARVMAVFTPLTAINAANGAIFVIPGSHRLGRLFHCAAPGYNLVCQTSAFREPRMIELEPGDLMALHSHTVHYSPENLSAHERINFGLHFSHRDTRIVHNTYTEA